MPLWGNIGTWSIFSWFYNDNNHFNWAHLLAARLKILKIKTVNYTLQPRVLDYTVRGAVRAAVSACVSTAGLHCKDVSCRRDTSSTEVRGSVSGTDPLAGSGSLFFLTSTFFVSLYPLSLEARDREALDFFSFFLWGSCTMLWRWRLWFMVNFLPQPMWVQT